MATTRGKRSKPARATPDLDALQEAVRHRFADRSILERALIHRSYAHEKGTPGHDSELLEFLGDAVLALAVSRLLLKRFPEAPVGTWRAGGRFSSARRTWRARRDRFVWAIP